MSHIVAGRFDRLDEAQAALQALQAEGFRQGEFDAFYVGPPGQHAITPIGGDAHSDAGAHRGGAGAALGATAGGLIGLCIGVLISTIFEVAPFAPVIGFAAVGAYLGSFGGALRRFRGARWSEASSEHPVESRGGEVVAVRADDGDAEPRAIAVLRRCGARDLGVAEGDWRDGSWRDFDPRIPLRPPRTRSPA